MRHSPNRWKPNEWLEETNILVGRYLSKDFFEILYLLELDISACQADEEFLDFFQEFNKRHPDILDDISAAAKAEAAAQDFVEPGCYKQVETYMVVEQLCKQFSHYLKKTNLWTEHVHPVQELSLEEFYRKGYLYAVERNHGLDEDWFIEQLRLIDRNSIGWKTMLKIHNVKIVEKDFRAEVAERDIPVEPEGKQEIRRHFETTEQESKEESLETTRDPGDSGLIGKDWLSLLVAKGRGDGLQGCALSKQPQLKNIRTSTPKAEISVCTRPVNKYDGKCRPAAGRNKPDPEKSWIVEEHSVQTAGQNQISPGFCPGWNTKGRGNTPAFVSFRSAIIGT